MAAVAMAANDSANDKVMPEQTITTAIPAGPATANTRHEKPTQTAGDHDGYARKSGKRRLLPRLVLVVLLASLLLIQLIESRYYENGYLQETLTSLTSYIDRGLEAIKGLPIIRGLSDTSTAPDKGMPADATMTPESATNTHPVDEIVATQKADAPRLDEPVTTVFPTGESGDVYTETTTTASPGESSGAAESGLTDANPGFSSIEAELAANYLPVERLGNGHLLINLSSTGMFEFDITRLSLSARAALTRLSEILGRHDGIGVHIVGHTDSTGHPQYNLRLSESRAKAVAEYLMTMGLPTDHIQSEGRGDLETRHEEATENQPELRRRVEIYLRPFTQE